MRIGTPAQEQLIACLRTSPSPAARAAAAWVLGHLGDSSVDRHLVRALDDGEDGIKLPAALMLGFRTCPEAVPALLRILTRGAFDDPSAPHPDQLALPLSGVGVYGEVVVDDPAADGYAAASPAGYAGASWQLALFADEPPPTVDDLGDVDLERWEERLGAAADFELSLAELDETFSDADFPVCGTPDQLVPSWVVAPWCHWSVQDLRAAATLSLARIADPRAVAALIDCAADDGEPLLLRQMAIAALGSIGDERAFETVYAALRDEDLEDEALASLGAFADRRALAPLIAAASAHDYRRISAVGSLAVYADPAALPYLCRLTTDDDGHVVCRALEGLARLGSQPALEAVARQLTHDDPVVRRQAAAALAWAQRRREAAAAGSAAPTGSIWHP